MRHSVSIDIKVSVADPKQARSRAFAQGVSVFKPNPGDKIELTYLSDGRRYFDSWVFDATVEWTAGEPCRGQSSPDGDHEFWGSQCRYCGILDLVTQT